jgi:S-DNA-T family DNA segregation ATPase FtsK/SpoIIIE
MAKRRTSTPARSKAPRAGGGSAARPKAKAKPKPRARKKAPQTLLGRLTGGRLPALEPYHWDLIGLALVAAGIFLAGIIYAGVAGGEAGDGLVNGISAIVGVIAYLVPVAAVAAGALVVFRPYLPARHPFKAGGACLFAATTLAFAAGTLGLGPGGGVKPDFARSFVEHRGGYVGEGLYFAAHALFSTAGAHIIAAFLFLAAVLLLTGATIAGVVAATRESVSATGQRLRETRAPQPGGEPSGRAGPRPSEAQTAAGRTAPLDVPDPADEEMIVKATHVEAPSLDASSRYPDLFGGPPGQDGDATEEIAAMALGDPGPEPDAPEPGEPAAEGSSGDGVVETDVVDPADLTPQGRYRKAITDDEDFVWETPGSDFLVRSAAADTRPDTTNQEKVAGQLLEALRNFGVEAKIVGTVAGPHITRYKLRLAPGTKVKKIAQLKDDIAYALAATEIRILAPIPGETAVGVEVPNATRKVVHLGDIYRPSPKDWSPLGVWLGKNVEGRAIGADLANMPHLLVAGTTGAGKSACVNSMLSSLLFNSTPRDLRLVLIDPKQVELNHYDSIPHLLTPVITNPRMAANALANLVREMEERYGMMNLARTRSLDDLNKSRKKRSEPPLPYILCVIDELADLMIVAPADVEESIIRLAQKARAVGIHLVLATQSPRVDVITGMIKANVPSRIAFAVGSQTDSRVILDQNGAESLLGRGDMLFMPSGGKLQRILGAYITEAEILELTDFWRKQGEPEIREELLAEIEPEEAEKPDDDEFDPDEDALLGDAIELVVEMGTASTSMLQRRLRLGYTRAGRLIDMLERRGVISGYEGSKPRQVLVTPSDLPRVLAALGGAPVTGSVLDDSDQTAEHAGISTLDEG